MEFFQFTPTWLVVALTWTRVFAIIFPFGIHGRCDNCSEIIILTILICTSFIISLTKLYSGGTVLVAVNSCCNDHVSEEDKAMGQRHVSLHRLVDMATVALYIHWKHFANFTHEEN